MSKYFKIDRFFLTGVLSGFSIYCFIFIPEKRLEFLFLFCVSSLLSIYFYDQLSKKQNIEEKKN